MVTTVAGAIATPSVNAAADGIPLFAVNAAGCAHTIVDAAAAVCLVRARLGRARNLEILGHVLLPPCP
jgi:hypothetical protein